MYLKRITVEGFPPGLIIVAIAGLAAVVSALLQYIVVGTWSWGGSSDLRIRGAIDSWINNDTATE